MYDAQNQPLGQCIVLVLVTLWTKIRSGVFMGDSSYQTPNPRLRISGHEKVWRNMRLSKPHCDCFGFHRQSRVREQRDNTCLVLWIILNAVDFHKLASSPPRNSEKWSSLFWCSMVRTPNHRFSVTKGRTVTPFESVLDSIKRYMPHPFTRTTKRRASLKGKSPVSSLKLLWGWGRASSDVNRAT